MIYLPKTYLIEISVRSEHEKPIIGCDCSTWRCPIRIYSVYHRRSKLDGGLKLSYVFSDVVDAQPPHAFNEKNFFEFERMLTSGYGDDLKFLILDPEGVQNPYVLSGPRGCIKLGEYSW